jgi:hypothetical protein
MTINVIRRLTDHDLDLVDASAKSFITRHNISIIGEPPHSFNLYTDLEYELDVLNDIKLKRLWQACKCRALKVPISQRLVIAYGHIGYLTN